jgi:hypothetical protein
MQFQELGNDQRREMVNTRQRYAALLEVRAKVHGYRGSMVWIEAKGRDYLVRSCYDKSGIRRQASIGLRTPDTERIKREYDDGRRQAQDRLAELKATIDRQSAINRAVGLGRIPLIGAKIIRALDSTGILGTGIRVLGTNAIYAYEAVAGVLIDSGLTTTEDIDLLLDSRVKMTFVAIDDVPEQSLLQILRKVDHSFQKASRTFRAVNREGYIVDLIRPLRSPPWKAEQETVGSDPADLAAVEIEGLEWHESAPSFESIAIDDRGKPLRIVTTDPRVWAAHKLWLSKREDREPVERRRDEAQARAVASLVVQYMPHLPFAPQDLRMLPRDVTEDAAPLFSL